MDITGIAHIKGIGGDLAYSGWFTNAALSANADQTITGATLSDNANVRPLRNGSGKVRGYGVTERRRTLRLTFFPTAVGPGASNTEANALLALEFPKLPAVVTISNAVVSGGGSSYAGSNTVHSGQNTSATGINGEWLYLGGAEQTFSEDVVGYTMTLVQEIDKDSALTNAQLVAAVS